MHPISAFGRAALPLYDAGRELDAKVFIAALMFLISSGGCGGRDGEQVVAASSCIRLLLLL